MQNPCEKRKEKEMAKGCGEYSLWLTVSAFKVHKKQTNGVGVISVGHDPLCQVAFSVGLSGY